MAGHSQFKNIMYRKGAQDAKRSKVFTKLIREITVAARSGLPDPGMNPRLRSAIQAARAANMPKDNVARAVKRATAAGEGDNFEEIRYEGYGPGGICLIVEALTDNRNRTASEVRSAFVKHGGNLAETGAVSFMFEHVGMINYGAEAGSADDVSKPPWKPAPTMSNRAKPATISIARPTISRTSAIRWKPPLARRRRRASIGARKTPSRSARRKRRRF